MPSTIVKLFLAVVSVVAGVAVVLDFEQLQRVWDTMSIQRMVGESSNLGLARRSDEDELSISMIVIASGQRSSSTFLSEKVLASMPCHLTLNEILNTGKGQAFGSAWEKEGKELKASFENRTQDPVDVASFVLDVGHRLCHEMLDKGGPELKQQCHNHCWVNYKHFSVHQNDRWKDSLLWHSLMSRLHGIPRSTFSMLVLERSVEERWKSTWFATQTGDWDTNGKAEHKQKIEAAEIPEVDGQFRYEHEEWYKSVRSFIRSFNSHRQRIPVLDLSFEDVTTKPAESTQALFEKHIVNLTPNCDNNDKPIYCLWPSLPER